MSTITIAVRCGVIMCAECQSGQRGVVGSRAPNANAVIVVRYALRGCGQCAHHSRCACTLTREPCANDSAAASIDGNTKHMTMQMHLDPRALCEPKANDSVTASIGGNTKHMSMEMSMPGPRPTPKKRSAWVLHAP
jgi:hypothetical protein